MGDTSAAPSARVGAATALLDRAWGRPETTFTANIQNAVEIPVMDVDALLAKVRGMPETDKDESENTRGTEPETPPVLPPSLNS